MSEKLFPESLVVPCLMSGKKYYDRARACRETWLSDFEKFYIFSETPDDSVPITPIRNAGEDWHSHRAKRYLGLVHALNTSPNAQWFLCVACDNFVFRDGLKSLMEKLENVTDPVYIGGHTGNYREFLNVPFASGGGGYLINRKAAILLVQDLRLCLTLTETEDVTTAIIFRVLGVPYYQYPGFHGCNPEKRECCTVEDPFAQSTITYHYMQEEDIRRLWSETQERA